MIYAPKDLSYNDILRMLQARNRGYNNGTDKHTQEVEDLLQMGGPDVTTESLLKKFPEYKALVDTHALDYNAARKMHGDGYSQHLESQGPYSTVEGKHKEMLKRAYNKGFCKRAEQVLGIVK